MSWDSTRLCFSRKLSRVCLPCNSGDLREQGKAPEGSLEMSMLCWVVVQAFDTSTQKAEASGSFEFMATLVYTMSLGQPGYRETLSGKTKLGGGGKSRL